MLVRSAREIGPPPPPLLCSLLRRNPRLSPCLGAPSLRASAFKSTTSPSLAALPFLALSLSRFSRPFSSPLVQRFFPSCVSLRASHPQSTAPERATSATLSRCVGANANANARIHADVCTAPNCSRTGALGLSMYTRFRTLPSSQP